MLIFLFTLTLAILFVPGFIYKFPKGYSRLTVTAIHAFLFTVVYIIFRTYVFDRPIEGFSPSPALDDETSKIMNRLSVDQIKALKDLTEAQHNGLAKLVMSMTEDQVEQLLIMQPDEIIKMINEAIN